MKAVGSAIFFFCLITFFSGTSLTDSLTSRNSKSETKLKNFEEDKKELERILALAKKGDPILQNKVGWMYDQGLGTKENPKEALKWYLKSARQGFRQAKINAGVLFEMGKGTPRNLKRANNWYSEADKE